MYPSRSQPSEDEKTQDHINRPRSLGSQKPPAINYASTRTASATAAMYPQNIIDVDSFLPGATVGRSNWNVEDGSLRPMPPLHPPMDRQCTVFIGDASPSVIAARVSDCLRRRSIVVEYDDETATARAVTSDRVRFLIRLYRGGTTSGAAFSQGVIVECVRTRGCPMTFHRACRAILSSAQGDIDGLDYINPLIPISGLEGIPSLHGPNAELSTTNEHEHEHEEESKQPASDSTSPSTSTTNNNNNNKESALMGLEIAWSLLKKDRVDANVIGMESLVFLTEERSSGNALARVAALAVLGLGESSSSSSSSSSPSPSQADTRFIEVHQSILSLIRDRRLMGEDEDVHDSESDDEYEHVHNQNQNQNQHTQNQHQHQHQQHVNSSSQHQHPSDIEHLSTLRTLALRALGNALELTAEHNGQLLLSTVLPRLINDAIDQEQDLVSSLVSEIANVSAPDNQAFNAHDAALAARILRILIVNSAEARRRALRVGAMAVLEKAKLVGEGRHAVLERESDLAFRALRETMDEEETQGDESGVAYAAGANVARRR